jgi:hypothetical protein
MNSLIKLILIVAITGVVGGLLSFFVYAQYYRTLIYPSEPLSTSILAGVSLSFLVYLIFKLVIIKINSLSNLLKSLLCVVASTLVVAVYVSFLFGITLTGLLFCTVTYGLGNFFMPYLDNFFSKFLNRAYNDR